MTIEQLLKEYYKKHPIRFKRMLKNSKVELLRYRNSERMLICCEDYFYKDEMICSKETNVDTNKIKISKHF